MEYRIYAIDLTEWETSDLSIVDLTDEEFIKIAEQQGRVYTLKGFESEFNNENISDQWYIRIIKIQSNS
jgi:hypothetical protein